MVINEINNILLRDAVIITLSLGEQTIFQEILWEGRRGNFGSELVFMHNIYDVLFGNSFLMFVAIIFMPHWWSITIIYIAGVFIVAIVILLNLNSAEAISWLSGILSMTNLISSLNIYSFIQQKLQTFHCFSFSNMKICCFSLSKMIVNWISLSLGLLIRQNKPSEDIPWAPGASDWYFSFYSKTINRLI